MKEEAASGECGRGVLLEARGRAGGRMRVLLWSELSIGLDQCVRVFLAKTRFWHLVRETVS